MYDLNLNSVDNLIETDALIEQHIHGGFGIDFSLCKAEEFVEFSKKILKFGVCGFFPTLATDSVENLKRQISEIKKAQCIQLQKDEPMAKILGVHLEACFLNPEKKGIHNEQQLLLPSVDNYKLIEDEIIKIVTLAPELDEDNFLCDYLREKGVWISAGHTVAKNLSMVNQVTHLYNAMSVFSHKEPSTVTSALVDDSLYVELIADYKHVQKDVLKITFKSKPYNKIILISDALPITHSNLDNMVFCSKEIFIKNGKAVSPDGTMAGSTSFVSDIIKALVKDKFLDLRTAASMASANIAYIQKPNAQIFWDSTLNICAMNLEGNLITF